jgi:hypothetical protein
MNSKVPSHWILGLLVMGFLASCGKKDEIRGESPSGPEGTQQPARPPQPNLPRDPSREGPNSQLQIACESKSDGGLSWLRFPSSSMASGDRFTADWEVPWKAPTIVSTSDGLIRFWANGSNGSVDARFDLRQVKGESSANSVSLPSLAQSALYRMQRIAGARRVAVSPNRRWIAVAGGDSVTLRDISTSKVVQRWQGANSLSQIRWEPRADGSSEVFADRLVSGSFRQQYLLIGADGKLIRKQDINPAAGFSALSLQRWDNDTLVWHEWSGSRSVIAFARADGSVVRFPISGRFGPGMAVSRSDGELSLGFVGREGLSFFSLAAGTVRLLRLEEFPPRVQEAVQENRYGWQPGAFYSQVNGTQLFTHLPATFGVMLFAVDGGRLFRQLGQYECDNPDFYLESL